MVNAKNADIKNINFYTKYLRAEVNKSSLPLHYLTVILHYVIMLKSQIKQ